MNFKSHGGNMKNAVNLQRIRRTLKSELCGVNFLFERNKNIGELYLLEKAILQAPQNEYSEEAAEGVRSLIEYYKSL